MTTPAAAYPPNPVVDRARMPPGPPEWPIVGQSFRYMSDVLGLMRESAGYGDLVTMSTKPIVAYLINHPDLIEECFVTNHRSVGRGWTTAAWQDLLGMGLVTSDDPLHLRQRRLMQPQFNHRRIAGYAEVMTDFARRHETRWQDGARVDMTREMGELTLHIVVRTLMGLDLPDAVRRIGAAFEIGNEYLTSRGNLPLRLRRLLNSLPLPFTLRFRRGRAFLDETVYGLIAQRRESGLDGDDLLSLLLNVRDEEAANPEDAVMTDVQLRDEVITLFAAGHETTAVALTWTWYLLATHPDIQARFHAELDDVLGRREPVMEDLSNLPFTGQVLTESMRLYPPIWSTGRMVFRDFTLGGWEIPTGAVLSAPQLIVQRDPRWFEDPLEFRPDRWTPEFRASLHRFAYYPFGGGPRLCIGEGFAWMEAMLVLATMGQRWAMRHDPRHEVKLNPLISLRPKGGMPLVLERRD